MSDAATTSPPLAQASGHPRLKKSLLIGAGLFAALVVLVVALPHFIDLARFKRTYLPLIENALGRRVDVAEVHLSLLPTPSIRLSKLGVSDTQAFAGNIFFAAQEVQLKIKFLPLLRGRFEVTELVLEKPIFNVLKQPDGSFNYTDIASKKRVTAPRRQTKKKPDGGKTGEAIPLVIPSRMRIRDGQVNLAGQGRAPIHVKGIELTLQELSGDAPFPFQASFQYAGLKTVALEGELQYQEDKALLELKNNRLKIHDLIFPIQGSVSDLAATPKVNLTLHNDNVDAKALWQILAVFGLVPGDIEIAGPMALKMTVSGPSNALVSQAQGVLKNVNVKGKRALKGTLTGDIDLRLPLGAGRVSQRLEGSGQMVARDGELTNANLIKRVHRVTAMIGLSPERQREATTFKTMEGNFTIDDGVVDFTRLYLINPQLEVNGGGTMTLDKPFLNLALTTTLTQQTSARAGRGRGAAALKDSKGRMVVPLKVTGPVGNPTVELNAGKLTDIGVPKNLEKGLTAFFKDLFRKR